MPPRFSTRNGCGQRPASNRSDRPQATEGEIRFGDDADRVGEIAIDDDGADPLARTAAAGPVLDPGIGQRDHGRTITQTLDRVDARSRMDIAAEEVVAGLDADGVFARPAPPRC